MRILLPLILLTIALISLSGEATALATPAEIAAADNIYISNVTYDPGSFFTGDTGTVTVAVTNGNTNQSVVANVEPVKPGREYKITVELRKNTPDGQLRGSIAIQTDDTEQSELKVPFYGIIGGFEG